ncbi:hypothetical protein DXG01_014389 [Tephrocybe rancida]|nr:hypothetical protein DXG01_014389 [Tephrocybe rancida]
MSPTTSSTLKQVSELFDACIAQVRSQPAENFDEEAAKWIKDARVSVMKQIEKDFSDLSKNAGDPKLVPPWAKDPSNSLAIGSFHHPRHLDAYQPSFRAEFLSLMQECGFQASVVHWCGPDQTEYVIQIKFPSKSLSEPSASLITKSFDSLPKFSAAVLRITEGVEEPLSAQDGPSAAPTHAAQGSTIRRGTKPTVKSTAGSVSTPKRRQGSKRAREPSTDDESLNTRRTSKRLRHESVSTSNITDEKPSQPTKPRRSGRR